MEEPSAFTGEFSFSYRTVGDHLTKFLSKPLPMIAVAVTAFGILWTFSESSIQLLQANPRGWKSYGFLIAASLISSLAWNGYLYSHTIPPGFEKLSRHAQRIAHWQRPLWEFQLAKALLAERLGPYDQELRDLEAGRVFVIGERPADLRAYVRWAESRIDNLFAMLAVAKKLLLNDFPAALQSSAVIPADPKRILEAVNTLAKFYGETVAFEQGARSIVPPDELANLHRHQLNWSNPIRDGVHQMFRFLQQMCDCDPKGDNHIRFEIVIAESPGITKYSDELSRLEGQL